MIIYKGISTINDIVISFEFQDASRSDSSLSRSQSPSSVPVVRQAKPIPQKQAYNRIHMAVS
jgi:hypothetical protein